MQFGWPHFQKPPIGTPLDRTHPLCRGMIAFTPLWAANGLIAADLIGGSNFTITSGATWVPGYLPQTGTSLKMTAAPDLPRDGRRTRPVPDQHPVQRRRRLSLERHQRRVGLLALRDLAGDQ